MTDLYDILGVPPDASEAEIRAAYRSRAKKAHPDAGGSAGEFSELGAAVRVLTNPDARARYDRTGETDDPAGNIDAEALGILSQILTPVMVDEAAKYTDVIGRMRRAVNEEKHKCTTARKELEGHAKRLDQFVARFTKRPDNDVLGRLMADKLKALHRGIEAAKNHEIVLDRALGLLEGYQFDHEQRLRPAYDEPVNFTDVMNAWPRMSGRWPT